MIYLNKKKCIIGIIAFVFLAGGSVDAQSDFDQLIAGGKVTVIDRTNKAIDADDAVAFGKRELFEAIRVSGATIDIAKHWTEVDRDAYLLIGTTDNRVVERLLLKNPAVTLSEPESVIYQWRETEDGLALIVAGTDERGLMYALLELAQRVRANGLEALTKVENTQESPDNEIRGLDRFLRHHDDDFWFSSEEFWHYYIGQLARNRFNRLTFIVSYTGGFMDPPYPFLVEVPGYENVKIPEDMEKTPAQNLAQLRRIAQICHAHGLEFVFGIWRHRGTRIVTGMPVDVEDYTKYCADGMRTLLREVPEIDGIQLRINFEAGVGGFGETAERFWKEIIKAVGDVNVERGGSLSLDLRAKGLTPNMLQWTLETGMNFNVATKYTCEAAALPYHPTQMRRLELEGIENYDSRQRYGYVDFLNKQNMFDVIFRLWNIGTHRMFTWADPDYARRFSQTVGLGNRGFQVTPPLSMKINPWPLFDDPSLISYKWEDERYWAWYLLFGRLGYSANTPPDVWEREFQIRYGEAGQPLLMAYQAAGKVLPLLTSAHLTRHPADYNWAEMDTGGALFTEHNTNSYHSARNVTYQSAEPADPGLFYTIEEYVADFLNESVKGKITPVQLVKLFSEMAGETRKELSRADEFSVPTSKQAEYKTSRLDLLLTADLADFHSQKMRAATDLVFYQKTDNAAYLMASLQAAQSASDIYKRIFDRTDGTYHKQPKFYRDLGTWADRVDETEKDVERLKNMVANVVNKQAYSHFDDIKEVGISLAQNQIVRADVPKKAKAHEQLLVRLRLTDTDCGWRDGATLHYRHTDMTEGAFRATEMQWDGDSFSAAIPAEYLTPELDIMVYFSGHNSDSQALLYPGLFNPDNPAPYFVVEIEE